MRVYQVAIVGILMIVLVALVIPNEIFAGPSFRILSWARKVLVINTESDPVPVEVINGGNSPNGSNGLGTKIVTFWENECSLAKGDISPVIDTDGYTRLSVHPFVDNIYWAWDIEVSLDNTNWLAQAQEVRREEGIVTYEIVAPYYRSKIFQAGPGCLTLKGYLK